jgi:Cys-tRNA(Pro) deacylase
MGDRVPGMPRKAGSAERVRRVLETHGLAGDIFEFDGSTKTAQMAADAVGSELGQIAKSLLVVDGEGAAAIAIVAGDRRGDLGEVAKELGWERARMGNAEEVRAATGYSIGGVSPFDLPKGLPVLVDDSLQRYETVWAAAGTPSSVVPLAVEGLVALSGGRVARISQ